jgi:hypothetical protein
MVYDVSASKYWRRYSKMWLPVPNPANEFAFPSSRT